MDPASPWQNGIRESFNGRFRDEFLTCEQFDTLLEVQILARLAHRVQHLQTPRLPGLAHLRRLPAAADHQPATNVHSLSPTARGRSRHWSPHPHLRRWQLPRPLTANDSARERRAASAPTVRGRHTRQARRREGPEPRFRSPGSFHLVLSGQTAFR
ncbi:integrase core domain-containing protein [Micromonospora sp. URMC 106]|uniref:integrase core domain-containing protein n=1 Tax=Micromonospora sp. URMC 106 TaxID=3423408 RepID=UPI003F1D0B5A